MSQSLYHRIGEIVSSRALIVYSATAIALAGLNGCTNVQNLIGRNTIPITPEIIDNITFNFDSEDTRREMKRQEDLVRVAHNLKGEEDVPSELMKPLYDTADREDGRRDRRITKRGAESLGYKLDSATLDSSRRGYTGTFKDILGR